MNYITINVTKNAMCKRLIGFSASCLHFQWTKSYFNSFKFTFANKKNEVSKRTHSQDIQHSKTINAQHIHLYQFKDFVLPMECIAQCDVNGFKDFLS